ncbi:MAG: hypothetical protein HQK51_05615 [Oligoflexia bacterium]|nr:hypothetical protein [Oligoflexia bacterium]
MSESKKVYHLILKPETGDKLQQMLDDLKNESKFLKMNITKLCEWIIDNYQNKYYQKEKQRIIEDHFNQKEFLKDALGGLSADEDVFKKIQDLINKTKNTNGNRVEKVKNDIS